ncbi:MAG: hypothetical protein H5T63_08290 [Chloroflexi bacterium]|nr:hypothetical protein [Chloroflexota bacterium]
MIDKRSASVIRASELGQYAFCARSWWLEHVQGCPSAHAQEMVYGQVAHKAHGQAVVRYYRLQHLAYILLLMAALVGAVGLYLLIRGL